MKKMNQYFALLAFAATTAPSMSHALVRELVSCTTSDGQYQVFASDNQGIGPIRKSHLSAMIRDASGNVVGSYIIELRSGLRSASFGRLTYQDKDTSGEDFLVQGPSTNFKNYILKAKLNANGETGFISDNNLTCTVFGGFVL